MARIMISPEPLVPPFDSSDTDIGCIGLTLHLDTIGTYDLDVAVLILCGTSLGYPASFVFR